MTPKHVNQTVSSLSDRTASRTSDRSRSIQISSVRLTPLESNTAQITPRRAETGYRDSKLLQIEELAQTENTLVLATVDSDGNSRSTPLFYLYDDLAFYWFSSPTSAHSKDLHQTPRAAAAVYRPTSNWKEIRGLQMRGTVTVVSDRLLRKALTASYCQRFNLGPMLRAAITRSRLYSFHPKWIRYLDNSRRFGYRFELTLKDPSLHA